MKTSLLKSSMLLGVVYGVLITAFSAFSVTHAYYYQPLTQADHDRIDYVAEIVSRDKTPSQRTELALYVEGFIEENVSRHHSKEIGLQLADAIRHYGKAYGYAVANEPVPLVRSDTLIGIRGGANTTTSQHGLLIDAYNTIDPVDMVVLPGTVVTIIDELVDTDGTLIYKVLTREYPSKTGAYIDSRLVTRYADKPAEREITLPSPETIVARMRNALGTPYVWGGNRYEGVDGVTDGYPLPQDTSEFVQDQWRLAGVDCSGLLYQATDGRTPRNTTRLKKAGTGLDIQGKTSQQIAAMLEPLDLIVWQGHVMIVTEGGSNGKVIESRHDRNIRDTGYAGGTREVDTIEILEDLRLSLGRTAVNDYDGHGLGGSISPFVVRRRYEG